MTEQDRTTTDSGAIRGGLLVAAGVYALLTALMFGDVLVSPRQVLSSRDNDLYLQFVPWREFAFGQLGKGNLPLWNPHLFCGAPFLGAPQSALLYPPNWLHLVLPVGPAVNWLIAMHIFWAGLTMYLWTRHRRLHWLACLAAGGVFMFSAVQFLHIVAGHLANLYLMPWVPLLFLAIDGVFDSRAPRMLSSVERRRWEHRRAASLAEAPVAALQGLLPANPLDQEVLPMCPD